MDKDIFVKLLQQRQFKAVRSILDVMNEVDIASLLSDLDDDKELALAFRLIPKDKAAEVFSNMDSTMQTYLVEMFTEKELKELLDDLIWMIRWICSKTFRQISSAGFLTRSALLTDL